MKFDSLAILRLAKRQGGVSNAEITQAIGMAANMAGSRLAQMTKYGYLEKRGEPRRGRWYAVSEADASEKGVPKGL